MHLRTDQLLRAEQRERPSAARCQFARRHRLPWGVRSPPPTCSRSKQELATRIDRSARPYFCCRSLRSRISIVANISRKAKNARITTTCGIPPDCDNTGTGIDVAIPGSN